MFIKIGNRYINPAHIISVAVDAGGDTVRVTTSEIEIENYRQQTQLPARSKTHTFEGAEGMAVLAYLEKHVANMWPTSPPESLYMRYKARGGKLDYLGWLQHIDTMLGYRSSDRQGWWDDPANQRMVAELDIP